MIIHKKVYTAFYFDFAKHFFSKILNDNERRTTSGRYCKLKSESLWKATRRIDDTIRFVIDQIIGEHGDWRIYYRMLYLYDTKPGDNKRVLGGGYQVIDGYLIFNALKSMGYNIPIDISEKLYSDWNSSNTQEYKDNVQGEILLRLYLSTDEKRSDLLALLKEEFYEYDNQRTKLRHKLPLDLGAQRGITTSLINLAQSQVEEFIADYFFYAMCRCFYDDAFDCWLPEVRKRKWQDNAEVFSKTLMDFWSFKNIHTWDFKFTLKTTDSAKANIKLFFSTEVHSRGYEYRNQIFDDLMALYGITTASLEDDSRPISLVYESQQWKDYELNFLQFRNHICTVYLIYCDNRWHLHKFTPITIVK